MNGPDFHDPDAGRAVARWMGTTLREVTAPDGPVTIVGEAPAAERVRDPEYLAILQRYRLPRTPSE